MANKPTRVAPTPTADGSASSTVGSGAAPITALRLRQLAEEAYGRENEEGYVLTYVPAAKARHPEDRWRFAKLQTTSTEPQLPIAFPQRPKDPRQPAWGKVDEVLLTYGTKNNVKPPDGSDALFWTPAAVEKFVLGYYLRLEDPDLWLQLYELVVNNKYVGTTVYAIAHTYPSIDEYVTDGTQFLIDEGWVSETMFFARLAQVREQSRRP